MPLPQLFRSLWLTIFPHSTDDPYLGPSAAPYPPPANIYPPPPVGSRSASPFQPYQDGPSTTSLTHSPSYGYHHGGSTGSFDRIPSPAPGVIPRPGGGAGGDRPMSNHSYGMGMGIERQGSPRGYAQGLERQGSPGMMYQGGGPERVGSPFGGGDPSGRMPSPRLM